MQQKRPKRKIAVIMSGGGMQCAYGAGALLALGEEYSLRSPDFLYAPSGAASSAAYFLAGQDEVVSRLWMSLATDPKFISLRRRPIVNVDYLVDSVMRAELPINLRVLKENNARLFFPVARARDGVLVYLRAHHTNKIYDQIRATLAAPYIYGKKVRVGRTDYMDGFFGYSVHDYMRHAYEQGARDIIVLASSKEDYRGITRAFLKSMVKYGPMVGMDPDVLRVTELATRPTQVFEAPHGVRVIVIAPTKRLPLSVLGGSKFNYRKVFNMGYDAVQKSPELASLLRPTEPGV